MPIARKKLIFIVGPTAIGKTRLAIELARRIKGEIISADSMQVYKGMPIISQAPTEAEKKKVPHHLTGFLSPVSEFNVASFRRRATKAIKSVLNKKKIPVIVGGSGLYVKALIDGLFPSPEADIAYRKKLYNYASRHGSAKLHLRLAKIDPSSAGRIHPNDTRRIVRALEIYKTTGKTMTELAAGTKGLKDEYDVLIFGLNKPRQELYFGIENRVDAMFRQGIIREVERLLKKDLSKTAAAVLGMKEVNGYLEGEYDLDDAKSLLKKNTRNFAKRQLTWFGADNRIRWFDVDKMSDEKIVKNIIGQIWKKQS